MGNKYQLVVEDEVEGGRYGDGVEGHKWSTKK